MRYLTQNLSIDVFKSVQGTLEDCAQVARVLLFSFEIGSDSVRKNSEVDIWASYSDEERRILNDGSSEEHPKLFVDWYSRVETTMVKRLAAWLMVDGAVLPEGAWLEGFDEKARVKLRAGSQMSSGDYQRLKEVKLFLSRVRKLKRKGPTGFQVTDLNTGRTLVLLNASGIKRFERISF